MGQVASQTYTDIYAWALMTNHAHILLRSGPAGLPKFMRRLLTGYAITYNRFIFTSIQAQENTVRFLQIGIQLLKLL